MPVTITCSHCQSSFKVAEKVLGKKVKCSACGKPFLAAEEAEGANESAGKTSKKTTPTAVRSATPPRPPLERTREQEEAPRPRDKKRSHEDDPDDRPKRSKGKRQKAGNKVLIIGLCAGGAAFVVLLAVGGLVAFLLAKNRRPGPINVAVAEVERPLQAVPEVANPVIEPIAPAPANEVVPPVPPPAPEPVPELTPAPAPTPEPSKPQPATPPPPATKVAQGTKITVRAEIQGSPPDFMGDFSQHVVQNLEIALRKQGYVPVPDGGLILQVRAQVTPTGKNITVRTVGAPPPRPVMKGGGKIVQPPAAQPPREQQYPLEQITSTITLTDAQGSAVWKTERKFTSRVILFRTANPPREMQDQMWRAFDAWARDSAVSTLKL